MKRALQNIVASAAIITVVVICGTIDTTSLVVVGPAAMVGIRKIWRNGSRESTEARRLRQLTKG